VRAEPGISVAQRGNLSAAIRECFRRSREFAARRATSFATEPAPRNHSTDTRAIAPLIIRPTGSISAINAIINRLLGASMASRG
jgi:hypothetical protein